MTVLSVLRIVLRSVAADALGGYAAPRPGDSLGPESPERIEPGRAPGRQQ